MKNRKRMAVLATLVLALVGTAAHAATSGSRFDATDFSNTNGSLTLTTETITFNTDTLSYSIDGGAAVNAGEWATSEAQDAGEGGNASAIDGVSVTLAMFNFNSINIGSGATIVVEGNAGIALGSLGDMTIATNISVDGTNGTSFRGGYGGSGAEGGVRNTSFASTPPGATAGDGGVDAGSTGTDNTRGIGFGAGGDASNDDNGDGAAYGGVGGGDINSNTYGDDQLTLLFGGSGGAGSDGTANKLDSGGGGGGGSIELTAVGTLTLSATLSSNGGLGVISVETGTDCGSGGGSGGGVLISASDIVLTDSALLSADGGDGGSGVGRNGGGGGGGRIAVYAENSLTIDGATIGDAAEITDLDVDPAFNVASGTGGTLKSANGTLFISVVPEPATMSLLALGGIAMLKRRKRA
ncbi:MAG: PEP-CTERM sorting domain-containing protein [Phycisphaerales bacterium]|nr:PEP-CTERM sorting domain-containing protein [Phycisphaerales bacterium]